MRNGVPTSWVCGDRGIWLARGSADAITVVDQVFPPRPEDPTGVLAGSMLQALATHAIRATLRASDQAAMHRRWWLEGFLLGMASRAADALTAAEHGSGVPAADELRRMATVIPGTLTADRADAAKVVFEIVEACLADDDTAAAWALEAFFVPVDATQDAAVPARLQHVCNAAVLTCAACWQLLAGAYLD